MTALRDEAERCRQRLIQATERKQDIEDKLVSAEAELRDKGFSPQIFAEVDEMRSQLSAQIHQVEALGAQLREAVANLAAENKLEEELRNSLGR